MIRLVSRNALVVCLTVAGWVLTAAPSAEAQVPQYYILQAPAPPLHQGGHGYHPGQAQPVSRPAYAYGYFGAQPRRHWSRHFGYYREYTQWSAR